ncbi:hypothetical protein AAC387_Pa08g1107 [Persea americana]
MERTCLAVVWAAEKLRHYFLAHQVKLLARMDPLKYIFEKPVTSGRVERWQMLLAEFDITYVTQKSIKGQAIADHLTHLPLPRYEPVRIDFPDESILFADVEEAKDDYLWTMYFDGALNQNGKGVGVVLLSLEGVVIPMAYKIGFLATNNTMEYEALLTGLREAQDLGVEKLRVFGDSKVVISQIAGEWKVSALKLAHYHEKAQGLMSKLKKISFLYIPRALNRLADSLAILASIIEMPDDKDSKEFMIRRLDFPSVKPINLTKRNPAKVLLKVLKNRSKKAKTKESNQEEDSKPKEGILARIQHDDDLEDDHPW